MHKLVAGLAIRAQPDDRPSPAAPEGQTPFSNTLLSGVNGLPNSLLNVNSSCGPLTLLIAVITCAQ